MTETRVDWPKVGFWSSICLSAGWVLHSVPDFLWAVVP